MNFENPFFKQVMDLENQVKLKDKFKLESHSSVTIAGMGGSGVSGRIFSALYQKEIVNIVDGYNLPEFVNKDTFFIAVSYSGNTEETISVVNQARERGIKVHAITSGGKLSQISDDVIIIPKGLQPRESLGYLLMPLLNTFMSKMVYQSDLGDAINKARSKSKEIEKLAQKIVDSDKIPYIISWEPFTALSYRFKTQFNENSKMFALNHILSEQNHNELVPMALNENMRNRFFYLCIEGDPDSRNARRMDMVESISKVSFSRISSEGKTTLEKLFYLIHYIDILTVQVAILRNYDPEDVKVLENLKGDLSKI
ncbi:bifunctional phosphoglucose/phosphomannose isomerase [Cuniculiplasma sp. SKW3]|uniref:bifunctional phosphoglucose/phosphomannose isomerase n=1 Tax=Cuniculiplasma sp. SKW3 TaxID=3400170 RepID=UPI003FD17A1C